MNLKITEYIDKKEKWTQELLFLRTILIEFPFEETLKWGAPTYVFKGKNVVGIAAFKNYFGLWFFQGGLLKDDANVLMNAQEEKTKAMRQWRFISKEDINIDLLKAYILEAIENVQLGKEIKSERNPKPLVIPEELKEILAVNKDLRTAFNGFTKSKQRDFANHISEAKREATKLKRLDKIIPMILRGEGLHDKYKNC